MVRPSEIDDQDLSELTLEFPERELIEELFNAVKYLKDKCSWIKNVKITNKKQERRRFKQYRQENKDFKPEFEFEEFPHNKESLLSLLDQCINASKRIELSDIEEYEAEVLSAEDFQELFKETFKELKLFVKLSANIEDERFWRKYSEQIWPMVEKETYQKSLEKLREGFETSESKKNVSPEKVKQMFEEEIDRVGMDYKAEIRDSGGCFNIPEDRNVVIARGDGEKRMYSQKELEMLTMHELFHAVRAYNGYKAAEDSEFPPLLGVHTPFYDEIEEGGALYREKATGTDYPEKWFDYHLRLVAAYEIHNSNSYIEDFQDIVEKLIDLGGSVDRSFYLVARNREALRHHIYLSGYHQWKEWFESGKETWPLLIGKLNFEWSEKIAEEIEANGMFQRPEIGAEKLFDFRYKDS